MRYVLSELIVFKKWNGLEYILPADVVGKYDSLEEAMCQLESRATTSPAIGRQVEVNDMIMYLDYFCLRIEIYDSIGELVDSYHYYYKEVI